MLTTSAVCASTTKPFAAFVAVVVSAAAGNRYAAPSRSTQRPIEDSI